MGLTIWVAPSGTLETLSQGAGGGHFWVHFNWVLGLRALGHRVVWLEWVSAEFAVKHLGPLVSDFERLLDGYGVTLAIEPATEGLVSREVSRRCIGLEAAEAADLLFNFHYALPRDVVAAFRRSALVDIDPGLRQIWITDGQLDVAPHDRYLTIGETIGRPGSRCPDAGLVWHYTSLPVCLDEWRPTPAPAAAPYTTVSNWWGQWVLWQGQAYANDKRTYFMEFAELPRRTSASLELALYLGDGDEGDRAHLERNGWTIRRVLDVCQSPFA